MRVLPVLLAFMAFVAPAAAAARCQAPAGTSMVDQYCETIPTDKGDKGFDPAGGGAGGGDVSHAALQDLARRGKDGAALVRSLGGNPDELKAAKTPSGSRGGTASPAGSAPVKVPQTPSANPFNAVRSAVSSSGDVVGSPFLLALFGVVVLMLGFGWAAHRRRPA